MPTTRGGDPDKTLTTLRLFLDTHRAEIAEDWAAVRFEVLKPISQTKKGRLSAAACFTVIRASAELVEESLRQICPAHSIDFWLTYVRRLPSVLTGWSGYWLGYATLAVLKWSNWSQDKTAGAYWAENRSAVVLSYSEADLFGCCRIAGLARVLAELTGMCRWLAKGAAFEHEGGGVLALQAPTEVRLAVEEYERRRPEASLFADEGILVDTNPPTISTFLVAPLIALGIPKPPLDRAILKPSQESFPINYFPRPRSKKALVQLLSPYEGALEDLFGINAEAIADVLQSISLLVLSSIPASDDENQLSFDKTLDVKEFAHKFEFMLALCRKGFVRFPEQHLRASIATVMARFKGGDVGHAGPIVDAFFRAFCIRQSDVDRIDVAALEPLSVLYTSPGGQCYLDLVWIDDFLRWLVLRSKEWFSSQHGDRFTLALKRTLNERVPAVQVVSWKSSHVAPSGETCEVDLLLEKEGVLYVVECKAYAKSRGFWLGDPDATRRRAEKITDAVGQAKKAAAIVSAMAGVGHSDLPKTNRIEWVVCLPSQEFLKPVDKYGYLVVTNLFMCLISRTYGPFTCHFGSFWCMNSTRRLPSGAASPGL